MLTDEAVGLVKQVPVVGNYVSSIYDLGTQAEAIGVISSGLDGIKSADLDDISNISKKTEKRIDAGISIVNKGLGIYTKYKATEINNQNVQKNQEELEKLSKPLMQKPIWDWYMIQWLLNMIIALMMTAEKESRLMEAKIVINQLVSFHHQIINLTPMFYVNNMTVLCIRQLQMKNLLN